jgi:L-gulonate 5-dehydrogenase
MQAIVFDAPNGVRLTELDVPKPAHGEALVDIRAAGLCAGDLYIFTGRNPYVSYPRVGGHEFAGRVVALGPDTAGPAPGSRVVIDPFIGCGTCYACRIGKRNCCANLEIVGVHRDGGFAPFATVPVANLVPTPDGLSDFHAAFAEPVAIGLQGCRRASVGHGDTVLVLGAGPIGLALVEVARARGAKVFATDIDTNRLDMAEKLGASPLARPVSASSSSHAMR